MLLTSLSYKKFLVYEKSKDKVDAWTGRDSSKKQIRNAYEALFEISTNLFVGKNVAIVKSQLFHNSN